MTTKTPRSAVGAATSLFLALAGCSGDTAGVDDAAAIGRLWCSGAYDGYAFEYEAVEFGNGDLFVSCSVDDGYAESGEATWWLAGSVGSSVGGCNVTADVAGEYTYGWWAFSAGDDVVTATYNDPGDPLDGFVVTLGSAVCVYTEPT